MNPMQPPGSPDPDAPYGAPPASPPMAAPGSINVAAFTAPENRGYLIAGIGGLIALISYFLFAFYGVSATALGVTRSSSFTGSDAAGNGGGGYWLLWLVPLAALVAIAVVCLIVLGINAVRQLTSANAGRYLAIVGAVGLIVEALVGFKANGDASSALGTLGATSSAELAQLGIKVSAGFGFGFWLTLLAFIAVIAGGVMCMRQTQSAPAPIGM